MDVTEGQIGEARVGSRDFWRLWKVTVSELSVRESGDGGTQERVSFPLR